MPTKKDSDAKPTLPANEPPRPGFADRVIKPVFKTFAHTADVLTRDMPRWLRPVARTGLFVGMLLFIVVTIPLVPLFRKQHRRFMREWESETRPVYELRLRAHRIWVEECPYAAAAHIRSVFDRARASPEGVEIPPYGRFAGVMCMHDLASAACEFELSVGRSAEAMEIAEFMCGQHTSDIGLGPTWIRRRRSASCASGAPPKRRRCSLPTGTSTTRTPR